MFNVASSEAHLDLEGTLLILSLYPKGVRQGNDHKPSVKAQQISSIFVTRLDSKHALRAVK
jgi:hypothetical protein